MPQMKCNALIKPKNKQSEKNFCVKMNNIMKRCPISEN